MATQRPRNRANITTSMPDTIEQVTTPILAPTALSTLAKTPTRSPTRGKTVKVTAAQKQALIDNLQLEIMERARRLRAQYALQAQGLRTRLEIRVHRIPPALRKRTIAEVLREYEDRNAVVVEIGQPSRARDMNDGVAMEKDIRTSPAKMMEKMLNATAASVPRGTKRTSEAMNTEADKENMSTTVVSNPKKRARTAPTPPPKPHTIPPRLVLSPRSNNSRMLPTSPLKPLPLSPFKSQIARPVSPVKPSVTFQNAFTVVKNTTTTRKPSKAKPVASARASSRQGATSAMSGSTRPKRSAPISAPPEQQQQDGRESAMSNESAGTTIVTTKSTTTTTSSNAGAGARKTLRVVQGRYTGPGAGTGAVTATTTTTKTTATANNAPAQEKEKEKEKEKKAGLAGKLAGIGAKAGRKVAGAAAKLEAAGAAAAATAAGAGAGPGGFDGGISGSVKGGRVLRKRG